MDNASVLNLPDDPEQQTVARQTRVGFWKRQFRPEGTRKQYIFDWLFGVLVPLICVAADPIVFKGNLSKGPTLGAFRPFAYLLSSVSILAMVAWLLWGKRLRWFNGVLSGLFAFGGFVALGIGIILLPFSLIGMVILIGFLGFTPLISSIVYLRNVRRCYLAAAESVRPDINRLCFAAAIVLSVVIPSAINIEIHLILHEMRTASAERIYARAEQLKYVYPLVNFDELGGRYCGPPDSSPEHQALADVYERFTGQSIERIDWAICEDF